MNLLEQDGFSLIKSFISSVQASQYLKLIKRNISKSASELEVTVEDYLSCTGRWSTVSPMTASISKLLDNKIKKHFEHILQKTIHCKKSNIICKTSDITDAVPFHQDISYSKNDPYHFSVWLSFNDIDKNSAPLQIVKNSHNNPVEPAVDFWSPYFLDKYQVNNQNIVSITVNAGDAIIFDSRLWHGSAQNHSHKDRFAYVTRWAIESKEFCQIPEIRETNFGMFNCGELTNQILEKSLILFDVKSKITNREKLIMLWIDIISKNTRFKEINNAAAIKDLKKLNILNKACDLHSAGNISGLVYKNLWFSLLSILNQKMQII